MKKLSIFITQPEYGVSKVTGECSTDRILVDKLIQNFPLLSGLREVYTSLRKILKSANPTLLDDWIERAKALGRKK